MELLVLSSVATFFEQIVSIVKYFMVERKFKNRITMQHRPSETDILNVVDSLPGSTASYNQNQSPKRMNARKIEDMEQHSQISNISHSYNIGSSSSSSIRRIYSFENRSPVINKDDLASLPFKFSNDVKDAYSNQKKSSTISKNLESLNLGERTFTKDLDTLQVSSCSNNSISNTRKKCGSTSVGGENGVDYQAENDAEQKVVISLEMKKPCKRSSKEGSPMETQRKRAKSDNNSKNLNVKTFLTISTQLSLALTMLMKEEISSNPFTNYGKVDNVPASNRLESIFYSSSKVDMPLQDYIKRVLKYTQCEESVFIYAFIYLRRMKENIEELGLTDLNLHRLFITSVVIAIKFLRDEMFPMSFYAQIGGIQSVKEMNRLELAFLRFCKYDLTVSDEEEKMYQDLFAETKEKYKDTQLLTDDIEGGDGVCEYEHQNDYSSENRESKNFIRRSISEEHYCQSTQISN